MSTSDDQARATRMLVLDDEPVITDALQAYFEVRGFVVDACSDRDEALKLINAHAYRVVIADLRLTGTSSEEGFDVIRAARAGTPGAVVILLTAYRSDDVERRAIEAGANLLLQKPRPLADIDRTVRVLLNGIPS